MPKVWEVYNKAIEEGKGHNVLSNDIRILISHIQGYAEPIDTLLYRDDDFKNLPLFKEHFARLLKEEPVEYIINEAKFLGRPFYVDRRVLIPRLETEQLVSKISEKVSEYFDPRNYLVVADIGTGSGCIALTLKTMFKNWLLTASDISKDALEVAKINSERYGGGVRFLEGSSLEPYIENRMNLDIIVSNPPYILNKDEVQISVRDYEPETALYLDKAKSVYEEIFRDYKKVKKGSLLMCFEIGYDLEEYLTDLMKKYLEDYEFEFIKDLDDRTRFLFVYLN
ncbi:MAG: peptide chain release factor N(5)-glutamine methyltransferase [Bacilli bacterium]|nr:peptide chain release factor N(5)-glutamine methyltransferase [Bacilli bacterium]